MKKSTTATHCFLYVLSGYSIWNYIASSVSESASLIQTKLDFAVHNGITLYGLFAKAVVDRIFKYFLEIPVLIVFVLVFLPEGAGLNLLLFLPFLALITLSSFAVSYLVNLLTILFPDLRAAISVVIRFMFFLTPIIWMAGARGGARGLLLTYNPAAYYLSLQRQVFGIMPIDVSDWLLVATMTLIFCGAAFVAYRHSHAFVRVLK
jgi:ABC-type polysaccharide/polyol phosphate export permease